MVSDLLPAESEAPRCSDFARALSLAPLGSGLRLDRALLVSTPGPWPKPALKHPLLQPLVRPVTAAAHPSRLFAAVPVDDDGPTRGLVLEVYERDGLACRRYLWTATDTDALFDLVLDVGQRDIGELAGSEVAGTTCHAAEELARPTFLVCTQGSHDSCCGVYGDRFADLLVAERPEYRVRRVSHTGGHRFAPTMLDLPGGRMWAFTDLALADRIAAGDLTTDDLLSRCRGWWGATGGAPQVAEAVARASRGRGFEAPPIITETAPDRLTVGWDSSVIEVEVRVTREVPSIACEAPGGLPAKPGREFGAHVVTPERLTA